MHPYRSQPDKAFWNRFVAGAPWLHVDIAPESRPVLHADTRVATAGSCFASNLVKWLPSLGVTPFVTEQAPGWFSPAEAEAHHYGDFSARYGNIYTVASAPPARRAGARSSAHDRRARRGRRRMATTCSGPTYVPGGFDTRAEASPGPALPPALRPAAACRLRRLRLHARAHRGVGERAHRHRVRRVPRARPPGPSTRSSTSRSTSTTRRSAWISTWSIDAVAAVNPGLQWIVTVSPVSMVATHTEDNVLVASMYSKSVLRAVCGAVAKTRETSTYFPELRDRRGPAVLWAVPHVEPPGGHGAGHAPRPRGVRPDLRGLPADRRSRVVVPTPDGCDRCR